MLKNLKLSLREIQVARANLRQPREENLNPAPRRLSWWLTIQATPRLLHGVVTGRGIVPTLEWMNAELIRRGY